MVFAGDLLFIGGTPVTWSGNLNGWIAACDTMVGWDPTVVVPGHGPITDVAGHPRGARLPHPRARAPGRLDRSGTPVREAAAGSTWAYADLPDPERIVISAYNVYRATE